MFNLFFKFRVHQLHTHTRHKSCLMYEVQSKFFVQILFDGNLIRKDLDSYTRPSNSFLPTHFYLPGQSFPSKDWHLFPLPLLVASTLGGTSRGRKNHFCSRRLHYPEPVHVHPIEEVRYGFINNPELNGPLKCPIVSSIH